MQIHKIGQLTVRFNQRQQVDSILNKNLRRVLNESDWTVSNGNYQIYELHKLFKLTSQARMTELNLWGNYRLTIIQQISHINFIQLRQLYLTGNAIVSIEEISVLHAPKLVSLWLQTNSIVSIRSLRKSNLRMLLRLGLYFCRINNFEYLSQANQPYLQKIYMECGKIVQGSSLDWIMKLESTNLKLLMLMKKQRIIPKKMESKISLKMPSIKIIDPLLAI